MKHSYAGSGACQANSVICGPAGPDDERMPRFADRFAECNTNLRKMLAADIIFTGYHVDK